MTLFHMPHLISTLQHVPIRENRKMNYLLYDPRTAKTKQYFQVGRLNMDQYILRANSYLEGTKAIANKDRHIFQIKDTLKISAQFSHKNHI